MSRVAISNQKGENQARTKQPLNAINDLAIKTNPQDPYYWMELSEGSHDYLKRVGY